MKSDDQLSLNNLDDSKVQTDETERLRSLVLGEKYQSALDSLLSHEEDEDRVADVISEAVRSRSLRDSSVAESLAPIVDSALQSSIDQNPKRIINVIFPILGPAIRKAVSAALADMVQSLNTVLEQSFNVKALWWRVQAKHAGMSYSQYAMLKTLKFRVEQVLLVHRETGLLLRHVAQTDVHIQDPELVSSMLTAITDFVVDSFSQTTTDTLDGIRFGEFQLYIDVGPDVIIATVVRGPLSNLAHVRILETLESIQGEFDEEIKSFDGNRECFAATDSYLQSCLLAQEVKDSPSASFPISAIVAMGAVVGLILYWGFAEYQIRLEIQRVIGVLHTEPGYVLVNQTRSGRDVSGTILRDPKSRLITTVSDGIASDSIRLHLDEQIIFFKAPESVATLVVDDAKANVERHLSNTDQVEVSAIDGVLTISGIISKNSLNEILTSNDISDQFVQIDVSNVEIVSNDDLFNTALATSVPYQRILKAIASQTFYFLPNSVEFSDGGYDVLVELVSLLHELTNYHNEYTLPAVEILIMGFSDSRGSEQTNRRISQQRADRVKDLLLANDVDAKMIVSWGLGYIENSTFSEESQRRVSISVSNEVVTDAERETL